MARPCLNKTIEKEVEFTCFKPVGIARKNLEKVELQAIELEAFRLSNLENISNEAGAKMMSTSAPTFNRLVKSASLKIADALVNGKGIRIYKQDGTHNCK